MAERKSMERKKNLLRVLSAAAVFAAASGMGYIFWRVGFPDTNIVVVYLLAVLVTVWITNSFVTGFLASLAATSAFNYFFAEPLFTFSVNDPNYIVTFVTMTTAALVTSTLTSHAKRGALAAQEKESETKAIYNLTNHLTDAKDTDDIAGIAVSVISGFFSCSAACLCFDERGMPERTFIQQISVNNQVRREVANIQEVKYRIDGLRSGFDAGNEFFDWPIYGRENTLGIIRIPKAKAETMNKPQMRLLHSMIESIALAMDRFRSAEQRIKSREEAVKERYRANLLRAISHDIRTPLSGILGTTEMLLDMTKPDDPRYALARGIKKDADWLRSVVENILNLTRIQDGKLALNKQPEAAEEVIGEAVSRMAGRAPEYEIEVSVPDELLIVPMDARLIEQVIINLLDNAVRHSGTENEISVAVRSNIASGMAEFAVRDRGTGIREENLPYIFQPFYTLSVEQAGAAHGIGLGLAICETIIKAHGGGIEARNRTDGPGAEFIFTLPIEEDKSNERTQ